MTQSVRLHAGPCLSSHSCPGPAWSYRYPKPPRFGKQGGETSQGAPVKQKLGRGWVQPSGLKSAVSPPPGHGPWAWPSAGRGPNISPRRWRGARLCFEAWACGLGPSAGLSLPASSSRQATRLTCVLAGGLLSHWGPRPHFSGPTLHAVRETCTPRPWPGVEVSRPSGTYISFPHPAAIMRSGLFPWGLLTDLSNKLHLIAVRSFGGRDSPQHVGQHWAHGSSRGS